MHEDVHDGMGEFPAAGNPKTHPKWWGKTFYKHFPNHGFVGDIFTVNGTAYPTLVVKRRKYRFRFLDASVARIYEFKLMASTQGPKSSASLGYIGDELEGQYRIPDGQQCMKFTQIASDGGLLPFALMRDSFELWPAKRREVIVDFTRYQDGTPTTKGDVIYLTNVMKMPNGRMWTNSSRFTPDPAYKVPVLKFVIGDAAPPERQPKSRAATARAPAAAQQLAVPAGQPARLRGQAGQRSAATPSGSSTGSLRPAEGRHQPDEPGRQDAARRQQKKNSFNLWEIRNGGGGWVHPFHLHMEEHRTVMRYGKDVTKLQPLPPRRRVPRGPGCPGSRRVGDRLPRVPRLHRALRGALPQPHPRGPLDDVRLGDHAVAGRADVRT